jgi:hypothetical protein
MPEIRLDQRVEGMAAAADINHMDGMLLGPAGGALSRKQMGILRSWGIAQVEVQGQAEREAARNPLQQLSPALAAQLTAELKSCFWHFDETNPMQESVFQFVLRRRARQLLPH